MTSYGRMLVRFIHSKFPISGITLGCCVWCHLWHAVAQYLSITFYKRSGCSTGAIGAQVLDLEGGTGIVIVLKEPKMLWARLVLLLSWVVLLITDGLEREASTQLQAEMARLALRARELM